MSAHPECDVSRCGRAAVLRVRFHRAWRPYCAFHGLDRRGSVRWPGYEVEHLGRSAPSERILADRLASRRPAASLPHMTTTPTFRVLAEHMDGSVDVLARGLSETQADALLANARRESHVAFAWKEAR